MTIKEVENVTGLTAKSIRYYEDKGLIVVERDEDNNYRNYSEENIQTLTFIKILRYLDFTVEEIGEILKKDDDRIKEILKRKAGEYEEKRIFRMTKKDICEALAKDYNKEHFPQIVKEYSDTIDFVEDEEGKSLIKELHQCMYTSLSATIVESFILSGPILWLFLRIADQQWDKVLGTAIAALIATVFLVLLWVGYFTMRKKNKSMSKEVNRKEWFIIPVVILGIISSFFCFFVIETIVEKVFIPEDFLFYQFNHIAEYVMTILIILFIYTCFGVLLSRLKQERGDMLNFLWRGNKWVKSATVIAFLVGMYCCMASVTVVTPDNIIHHSFYNPKGTAYGYEEVEKIQTGFGDKTFTLFEHKREGSFYYAIYVDGKKIVFDVPTDNENIERYIYDTYLELEELDRKLVIAGVPKESSDENWKSCDFEKQYVDRFLRIIRNT